MRREKYKSRTNKLLTVKGINLYLFHSLSETTNKRKANEEAKLNTQEK